MTTKSSPFLSRVRDAVRIRRLSIRTVQEQLGQQDVRTTQINSHVQYRGGMAVKSPLRAVLKIGWEAALPLLRCVPNATEDWSAPGIV